MLSASAADQPHPEYPTKHRPTRRAAPRALLDLAIAAIVEALRAEHGLHAPGGSSEALLASELAAPLEVSSISQGPATGPGGTDQPIGHRRQVGAWVVCEACDNPPGLSAAGRANLTLPDWARLIQELLRADAGGSTLIAANHGRRLFTGLTPLEGSSDRYALGWVMTTHGWAGGRTATHTGSNTVNHSAAWLGLGAGIASLADTNAVDLQTGSTGQALNGLVVRILELHTTGN